MDDILITDPEAEQGLREAVDLLIRYLQTQRLSLTPEEWFDALADIRIPDDAVLKLSDEAVKQGVILMDRSRPEREPFRLHPAIRLPMLVKSMAIPLTFREWDVLCYRCGLADNTFHTLEETAACFGVTRERIRQIENKLLRRIRAKDRRRQKPVRDFYQ